MARYIYKYSVLLRGPQQILLDEGAEVLAVGMQYDPQWLEDVVVFWAYCEDGKPNGAPRTFVIVGTGHEVPEGAVHRGTVQQDDGFVWHLMEVL
jgi:hypothetical protein